jgi:hypothetical protein
MSRERAQGPEDGREGDDGREDDLGSGGPSDGTPGPTETATYKVGYGKPPLHSRFRAGEPSRNPRGRPKGQVNLKTDLAEELAERITLPNGDRPVRMTKQRALLKSTMAKAIKGDARARDTIFRLAIGAFGLADGAREEETLSPQDQAILDAFVARKARGER